MGYNSHTQHGMSLLRRWIIILVIRTSIHGLINTVTYSIHIEVKRCLCLVLTVFRRPPSCSDVLYTQYHYHLSLIVIFQSIFQGQKKVHYDHSETPRICHASIPFAEHRILTRLV
jgi:hypothetical protein